MSGVSHLEVSAADDDLRLDRWFQRHYEGLSHGRLQKLLRTGQVRVDGKRVKGNVRLKEGQVVRVPPLEAEKTGSTATPELSAADAAFVKALEVHRDADIIAVNKPAGLAVQGGSGTRRHLDGMLDGLRGPGDDRPRLVHRLDKDTSGVLILARSAAVADRMGRIFKHGTAHKQYWALVMGVPHPLAGVIDLPLSKQGGRGHERMAADHDDGKRAVTKYRVVETAGRRCAWVALFPETGRTHQLRAHLAAIGHPIVGDGKYGGQEAFLDGAEIAKKMHLHARSIELPGEGRSPGVLLKAPLTAHMADTWRFFGFDPQLELADDALEG